MTEKITENGTLKTAEQAGGQSARAVDIAVGTSIAAAEKVGDAIEPWTRAKTREQELKTLRRRFEGAVESVQRRGNEARTKLTQKAKSQSARVSTEVQERRRQAQTTTEAQVATARQQFRKAQERAREVV